MSQATTGFVTSLFQLFFNATAWSSIAQNSGSPLTQFYISLHNAAPLAGGAQNTSETIYTNYARVAVNRTSGGFTVGGSAPTVNVTNAATVSFAQCGATGDTITHVGIGSAASGAGTLYMYMALGPGQQYDFTATLASPGVFTLPGSSLALNARVSIYQDFASGQLPGGASEGTVYYVGTNPSSGQYTLSTTVGNANPVNTSTVGAGFAVVGGPLAVSNGVTPAFAPGQMIFYGS